MTNNAEIHTVYRALNKPLTIWGVQRGLFFLALIMGTATFNLFGTLLGGILMFAALFLLARWATAKDDQLLRIVLNSAKFATHYDPAKRVSARRRNPDA